MEELARSNGFAWASGVLAAGTSGPSESEMLQKLQEFVQVNPWATKFAANHRLVAVRAHGADGAEDKPLAGQMNHDEQPVSPRAAPVTNLDVSTPETTLPEPSPTPMPPSTCNVATTQPPASVTLQACGSSTLSLEHAQENHPSTPERRCCRRRRLGGK